jgi:hypothetical protein
MNRSQKTQFGNGGDSGLDLESDRLFRIVET